MKQVQILRRHLPSLSFVAIAGLLIAGFGSVFVYLGVYNIGADAHHSKAVYWAIEKFRNASIAHHARNIVMPVELSGTERLARGAGLYGEMCSGCHLGPGAAPPEISQGLYPKAPQLSQPQARSAEQQFWIIKHGVKMTAMPAWGATHSDEQIWDMVAFVRTLPTLPADRYQSAIETAPANHDMLMNAEGTADMPMAHDDADAPHHGH